MADLVTTIETDIEDVVNILKTFGATAVNDVKAIVYGIEMGGTYAAALSGVAQLLKDAQAAEQTLAADVEAAVPANVKAFLAGTGTLEIDLNLPVLGAVTGVVFKGNHDQFVAAVAGGTAI